MKLTRRDTLTLAAMTAAGLAGLPSIAFAKEGDMVDQARLMNPAGIPDKVLGDPAAKVTVIEYASPTCPHCATFHNNVLSDFKAKYVASGQVKFILRPFARNTIDAAIFMLAEHAARAVDAQPQPTDPSAPSSEVPAPAPAAGTYSQAAVEAYENVLAAFFKTQTEWASAPEPLPAIQKVTTQLGFSEATFTAALTDQDLFKAIETMRNQAIEEFGLDGTPTFYINGKQLTGDKTLDVLSTEIDPLL